MNIFTGFVYVFQITCLKQIILYSYYVNRNFQEKLVERYPI